AVATLKPALRRDLPGQPQRLHLLERFGELADRDIIQALGHRNPGLREHALQLAEPRLNSSKQMTAAALKLENDPDPRVRMQYALTIGALESDSAVSALAGIAVRGGADPWTRLAVLTS